MVVEVQRNLRNGNIQTVRRILFQSVNVEDFPNMELSSSLIYNKTLSLYELDYTIITRFSPATLSFINNFFVSVTSRTGNGDQPGQYGIGLYDESIEAMVNQSVYTIKIFLRPFTVPNNRYDVSVHVIWEEDERLPQPTNFINVRDAVAPPPLPVRDVYIIRLIPGAIIEQLETIDVAVTAIFSFEAAELLFEHPNPTQCDIHFGLHPADENTVPQPVNDLELIMSTNRLQGSTFTRFRSVPKATTSIDAVLQIWPYQFSDFRGNWSEPVYVQLLVLDQRNRGDVISDLTPQFRVGIPSDGNNSLCYEVHGAANRYFNLVSDTCRSVNALYTPIPSNPSRNRISQIGIKSSSYGYCVEVKIDVEGCVAYIGETLVTNDTTAGGIRVKRIEHNKWEVTAQNCLRPEIVMLVTCYDFYLRLDANTASNNVISSIHGLIGQFWNIPLSVVDTVSSGHTSIQLYQHDHPSYRLFPAFFYHLAWDLSDNNCYYAGNSQGGPERSYDPLNSVIEGSFDDYIVNGLFETQFTYNKFNGTSC